LTANDWRPANGIVGLGLVVGGNLERERHAVRHAGPPFQRHDLSERFAKYINVHFLNHFV
jgi:hypothetical protein